MTPGKRASRKSIQPRLSKQKTADANASAKRTSRGRRSAPPRPPKKRPASTHALQTGSSRIPPPPNGTVRIIPLGGVEEIGRNMTVVETADDLIVVDAGFQFVSEGDAPGIDYILPNTTYIEERKDKLRGLIVTHGHLDHIGGIPFIMERIGNPPVYTQYLTSLMILKRQEEFPHMDTLNVQVVKEGENFTLGTTKVKTFAVTHSIPDAMGLSIETPHGDVVITGDIRLTHKDGKPVPEERKEWERVGKNNNLIMLADSTNAHQEGFSTPEAEVFDNLEKIIKEASGRLIIGTFASQFERLIHVITMCEKYGKVVVPEGRSIKTHIDIALAAKMLTVKSGVIISAREMENYPVDRVVILATGAQGEEFAALMRMALGKHKSVALTSRDTLVLSSSVIPGNEIAVQKLKDNIYRKNVRVINYRSANVHASGHGNAGELNWVRETVKPKFLMPVHGHHFHLKSHMFTAIEKGFPKNNIVVPDNGMIIDIEQGKNVKIRKDKAPSESMMVDGLAVGNMQEVVIRDRQALSKDGMFVIVAVINLKTGKLKKSPDLISRGFVYLRESQPLLQETRLLIKKNIEDTTKNMNPINFDYIKDTLTDTVERYLFQKTSKRPIVIPVILGI